MTIVTFEAEEHVVEKARAEAQAEGRTLEEVLRSLLDEYGRAQRAARARALMDRTGEYVRIGRKFTREEMNER
jgi:hypothetical protein